jgi:deoxyribose-phosphate aldolase
MTRADIDEGCEIAAKYDTATVCVRGYDVAYCAEKLKGTDVKVCVVTGFPHGNSTTAAKVFESRDAIANGAREVDVVIPIGLVRSGMYGYMEEELAAVLAVCKESGVLLKVIFENAYLSKEEIARCAQVCDALGVAFVKTSTGYAPSGANVEDVKIMRKNAKDSIKIKAAGGIRTLDQLLELYEAGVTRFGTRSTAEIMTEAINRGL